MKTLKEMMTETLALIEELNPDSEVLTDDPDIATKIKYVINQVMFELARMKKIPDYVEMPVNEGDTLWFEDIAQVSGYNVYQLAMVGGVDHDIRAGGTIIKVLETGTAEIEYYRYPKQITDTTEDSYEFELSEDVLAIMPYGVAGNLLKSDVSANYGQIYSSEYQAMLQKLDPRYAMTSIRFEGGVNA